MSDLSTYCRAGLPWECTWWGSIATFWNPTLYQPCREAEDLYAACMAGGFNRNLPGGSGAGPAPGSAAQPGVNYNDPAALRRIQDEQRASDSAAWFDAIEASRKLVAGAPERSDTWDFPWLAVVLFVALFAGFALIRK